MRASQFCEDWHLCVYEKGPLHIFKVDCSQIPNSSLDYTQMKIHMTGWCTYCEFIWHWTTTVACSYSRANGKRIRLFLVAVIGVSEENLIWKWIDFGKIVEVELRWMRVVQKRRCIELFSVVNCFLGCNGKGVMDSWSTQQRRKRRKIECVALSVEKRWGAKKSHHVLLLPLMLFGSVAERLLLHCWACTKMK